MDNAKKPKLIQKEDEGYCENPPECLYKGHASRDRLNFPCKYFGDIPIDIHKALTKICGDLVAVDYTSNGCLLPSHCNEIRNRIMAAQTYVDASLSAPRRLHNSFTSHGISPLKRAGKYVRLGRQANTINRSSHLSTPQENPGMQPPKDGELQVQLCTEAVGNQERVGQLFVSRRLPIAKQLFEIAEQAREGSLDSNKKNPSNTQNEFFGAKLAACTHDTLCFVYLRQEGLCKIMNLEKIMKAKGWYLEPQGHSLLKGAMVVVTRPDSWRLRRISSCDLNTMDLHLEDETCVSLFDISDKVLEAGGIQLDYLTGEYCNSITTSKVEPLVAHQVLQVFYNLLCCSKAVCKLPASDDCEKLIRSLAQKLADGPSEEFIKTFDPFLKPYDALLTQKQGTEYLLLRNRLGATLPSRIRHWLGKDVNEHLETAEIDIDEDIRLYTEQLEMARVSRDGCSEQSTQEQEKPGSLAGWKPHELACDDAYAKFCSSDDNDAPDAPRSISLESTRAEDQAAGSAKKETSTTTENASGRLTRAKRKSSGLEI